MEKLKELIRNHIVFLLRQSELNKSDPMLWNFILINLEALVRIYIELKKLEHGIAEHDFTVFQSKNT